MISFQKEQIFIVTGASSGIGEATAILLNSLGATIIGIGRSKERLEAMKTECKYPQNVFLEQKDLAEDIENLPNYVKNLKEKYGKFSGMAYCAGVVGLNPLKAITYEYAKKIFDINYFSPLMMIKGIADKRNNISSESKGYHTSIVCVSSIDALLNSRGQSIYVGTKSALSTSSTAISKEIARNNIRINCVLPSMIRTPMIAAAAAAGYSLYADKCEYPFGWGEPNDVANMICFLLSDKAKFISGQNYVIHSGGVGGF